VLPNEENIARICAKSTLVDGKPGPGSFQPHPGKEGREPDAALSVHWLEYRCRQGALSEKIGELRKFLLNSPFNPEFKPTAQGLIAALPVGRLQLNSVPELGVEFECFHSPRSFVVVDPHSDLCTKNPPMLEWPEDEAFRLAVQQFICDQVEYAEPGKA
jgi:hypothetical protein